MAIKLLTIDGNLSEHILKSRISLEKEPMIVPFETKQYHRIAGLANLGLLGYGVSGKLLQIVISEVENVPYLEAAVADPIVYGALILGMIGVTGDSLIRLNDYKKYRDSLKLMNPSERKLALAKSAEIKYLDRIIKELYKRTEFSVGRENIQRAQWVSLPKEANRSTIYSIPLKNDSIALEEVKHSSFSGEKNTLFLLCDAEVKAKKLLCPDLKGII